MFKGTKVIAWMPMPEPYGMSTAMKEKDAPETIDEVKKEICDHYCKWPEQFGDEGFKEMLEAKCSECPLNRL